MLGLPTHNSSGMCNTKYDYVIRSLKRLNDEHRQTGFAPLPHVAQHRLVELTDNEQLHITLGVET
jgi:hypothetical protein